MGLHDMAKMTVSGTPGTGTITLGSAVAGFQSFASAGVLDGERISYSISDTGNAWEVGRGTYTAAGTTLSRGAIFSSNSNSAINATSSAIVFIAGLAEDFNPFYPAPVAPINGLFSWVNQGSASVTVNDNGGIALRLPTGSGVNIRGRYMNQPATPYTLTTAHLFTMTNVSNHELGISFTDGTKFSTWEPFTSTPQMHCGHWTNSSTFGSDAVLISANVSGPGVHWLQVKNDGATLTYNYSADGYTFVTLFTEAVGAFITPTQIGFHAINNLNTKDCVNTLLSWKLS